MIIIVQLVSLRRVRGCVVGIEDNLHLAVLAAAYGNALDHTGTVRGAHQHDASRTGNIRIIPVDENNVSRAQKGLHGR